MMFTVRVSSKKLFERIAAEAHSPDFLAATDTIAASGLPVHPMIDLVDAPINNSIRDVAGELNIEGAAIPMYRPADMTDGWLLLESAPKISATFEAAHAKSRVAPGDIVLAIAGTVAEIGRVPPGPPYGNINGSSARIKPKSGLDGYLHAFLRSRYGRLSLLRFAVGSVQRHLNLEDLPQVPIVLPNDLVQRYIGDKVRQAERLRERAQLLEAEVRREYRAEIDRFGYIEVPHRKSFRSKLRARLDPGYYDPAFTSVLDAPWLTRNSEPLSKFFADGSYGDLPDSNTYGTGDKWLLRATDLDLCMTHWDAGVRVPAAEVGAKSQVKENDILLEVKGAIEKCALGRGPAVGKHVNGTVFRLSPSGINAGYLCLHLTGEIKRKYAGREAVNNIIQYLNLDCIRALPVLRLDPALEERLGDRFTDAIDARAAAASLTSAAVTLVERLIDGRIGESDLIAAQNALAVGDHSRDREILRMLKESDTREANPLIADVDALYALLHESEEHA